MILFKDTVRYGKPASTFQKKSQEKLYLTCGHEKSLERKELRFIISGNLGMQIFYNSGVYSFCSLISQEMGKASDL